MPTRWHEIPAIPLAAFRHVPSVRFPRRTVRSFRTSGTTGEGYGEHHFRTLELYRSAALTDGNTPASPGNLFCLMRSPEESPTHR